MRRSTLSNPLRLEDGRSIETQSDARCLMLSLRPIDQAQDRWQRRGDADERSHDRAGTTGRLREAAAMGRMITSWRDLPTASRA